MSSVNIEGVCEELSKIYNKIRDLQNDMDGFSETIYGIVYDQLEEIRKVIKDSGEFIIKLADALKTQERNQNMRAGERS